MNSWSIFVQSVTPAVRCLLCSQPARRHNLCSACLGDLPLIASACGACGTPLPTPAPRCGACLDTKPAWDSAACAFRYAFPVDYLLRRLKFAGQLTVARGLGEATAVILRHRPHARIDAIVPVPLHWRRCWRRSFNQAHELARPLARALRLPLANHLLTRRVATRAQSRLRVGERQSNLRAAFDAKNDVCGKRLIVFDDVLTTGATAGAAAQALRQAGAREVLIWCCARASRTPLSPTGC